jgi:exopolyphosphatase/pppGpp-phosphohydrolase
VGPAPLERTETDRLQAVLQLAQRCGYEAEHAHQVTRLALRLFDELQPLHGQGDEERFWLQCGALLHDIGWIEGQQRHHKTSLQIILNAPLLPFDERERLITASIARYHRKALPRAEHEHFAALEQDDQHIVRVLAGMLRVADGLDRTHWCVVKDLSCEISVATITVRCIVNGYAEPERLEALEKGALLEQVFHRQLAIECELDRASVA